MEPEEGLYSVKSASNEVERQHRQASAWTRKEHQMWWVEQVSAGIIEQRSPTRLKRSNARPEKGHNGFGQHGSGRTAPTNSHSRH
jgi:hypothetical protein